MTDDTDSTNRIKIEIKETQRRGNLATFSDVDAKGGFRAMTDAEMDAHDKAEEVIGEIDAEAHESGDVVAEIIVEEDDMTVEWADDVVLKEDGGEPADGAATGADDDTEGDTSQ